MIIVLTGADELALRRRLRELREEADGGTGMIETNANMVDGRDAKPADILGPATAMPFLSPKRIVIVENLLERFESRPGERRTTRTPDAFAPLFAGLESGLPETTILVFTGAASARNPMVTRLKQVPGVVVEDYPELKGDTLQRFIREEAGTRGMRLDGPSITALATMHGGDTLALANELDKLSLYTMGRAVTRADVDAVSSADRDARIYEYTDAVLDGDLVKAMTNLRLVLLDPGSEPDGVLASLYTPFRTMATILDLLESGATPDEIGAATNQRFPGLRDRAITRAKRLGRRGLRSAYEQMVATDRANKAGLTDTAIGIELLTARLCALSRPTPAR